MGLKKVTYSLPHYVVSYIESRSKLCGISCSDVILEYLKEGLKIMEIEFYENNGQQIEGLEKKYPLTIKKTFYIPFEVYKETDFYSYRLGIKKSHIVSYGCVYIEEGAK